MITRHQFKKHLHEILSLSHQTHLSHHAHPRQYHITRDTIKLTSLMDDCLETPYVDLKKSTMSMLPAEPSLPRLITAWLIFRNTLEPIYDEDNEVNVSLNTPDDLYDYLYVVARGSLST